MEITQTTYKAIGFFSLRLHNNRWVDYFLHFRSSWDISFATVPKLELVKPQRTFKALNQMMWDLCETQKSIQCDLEDYLSYIKNVSISYPKTSLNWNKGCNNIALLFSIGNKC